MYCILPWVLWKKWVQILKMKDSDSKYWLLWNIRETIGTYFPPTCKINYGSFFLCKLRFQRKMRAWIFFFLCLAGKALATPVSIIFSPKHTHTPFSECYRYWSVKLSILYSTVESKHANPSHCSKHSEIVQHWRSLSTFLPSHQSFQLLLIHFYPVVSHALCSLVHPGPVKELCQCMTKHKLLAR